MRGAFDITTSGSYALGNGALSTNLIYEYVSDENYYNDFSSGNVDLVTKRY